MHVCDRIGRYGRHSAMKHTSVSGSIRTLMEALRDSVAISVQRTKKGLLVGVTK